VWFDLTPSPPLIQWSVVLGATLTAAVTDLCSRRIPNFLSIPVLLVGIAWKTWNGGGMGTLDSLAACVLLSLPYVLLFVFAGGGAGDAKMMGAVGAWVGVVQGVVVLGAVAACGIILALAYAAAQRQLRPVLNNITGVLIGFAAAVQSRRGYSDAVRDVPTSDQMTTIPYGVAIFLGVCLAAGGLLVWHR
jgi:prepilin peptidase CpaA